MFIFVCFYLLRLRKKKKKITRKRNYKTKSGELDIIKKKSLSSITSMSD